MAKKHNYGKWTIKYKEEPEPRDLKLSDYYDMLNKAMDTLDPSQLRPIIAYSEFDEEFEPHEELIINEWKHTSSIDPEKYKLRQDLTVFNMNGGKSIGYQAFAFCTYLEKVSLPKELERIDAHAFLWCRSLKRIDIPEGVTSIGKRAFACCQQLEEVTLPSTIKEIKPYCFEHCTKLKRVIIPSNAEIDLIGHGAFRYCRNLEECILPKKCFFLKPYIFWGTGFKTLANVIGQGSYGFQEHTFKDCENLEEIVNMNHFGRASGKDHNKVSIFSGCDNVKKLVLPEECKYLEDIEYHWEWQIEEFRIPPTCSFDWEHIIRMRKLKKLTIGFEAFHSMVKYRQERLQEKYELIIEPPILKYKDEDTPAKKDYLQFIKKKPSRKAKLLDLQDKTKVSREEFMNDESLVEIIIPDTVKLIEENAFSGCKNLKVVHWDSENINEIQPKAFSFCKSLEYIDIPRYVKTIPERCFISCEKLKYVHIHRNSRLEVIKEYAFDGCYSLQEINFPNGLKKICESAFAACTAIEKVVLPDSCTIIEQDAFSCCDGLCYVKLPNKLEKIEPWTFASTAISNIDIPKSVKYICKTAFDASYARIDWSKYITAWDRSKDKEE